MTKMKDRNSQLRSSLGAMASKETVQAVANIPAENAVNRQGYKAYSLCDELRLISMLNVLKLGPQFYRSEGQTMKELRDLIEREVVDLGRRGTVNIFTRQESLDHIGVLTEVSHEA